MGRRKARGARGCNPSHSCYFLGGSSRSDLKSGERSDLFPPPIENGKCEGLLQAHCQQKSGPLGRFDFDSCGVPNSCALFVKRIYCELVVAVCYRSNTLNDACPTVSAGMTT